MDLFPRGRKMSSANTFIIFTLALCLHANNRVHSGPNERQCLESGNGTNQCNLFSGAWVWDASYPLYDSSQCSLIRKEFNCRGNGRPDSDYEKWRWQPYGCNIPRFNATNMMERLRGKRLMFVGDSLTSNQFISMVCLVRGLTRNTKLRLLDSNSNLVAFNILEYNASIQFHWASFLVDFDTNPQGQKVLHLDAIENNGAHWKGVDILVFETSHWWAGRPTRWDILMDGNEVKTGMDTMEAYKKALITWSNWVSKNLDPRRSQVFYSTTSLRHYPGCGTYREPVKNTPASITHLPEISIAKEIVHDTKFPVVLLDITELTVSRWDGHVSTYSSPQNKGGLGDCSHWCLPGVPDEWNRLLYATLASINA